MAGSSAYCCRSGSGGLRPAAGAHIRATARAPFLDAFSRGARAVGDVTPWESRRTEPGLLRSHWASFGTAMVPPANFAASIGSPCSPAL